MTGVLCQSNLIMIAVMAVKQLSGIWDPSLFVSIQSNSVLHTSTHSNSCHAAAPTTTSVVGVALAPMCKWNRVKNGTTRMFTYGHIQLLALGVFLNYLLLF